MGDIMTHSEYVEYQEAVESFFVREGIQNLSQVDLEEESWFSWCHCDCCNSRLGGDRYHASGFNPKTKDIQEYEVCSDCLYYAEYGCLDDTTMMDLKEEEK